MDIVTRLEAVDFEFWYQPLPMLDTAESIEKMPKFEIGKMAHEAAKEIRRLRDQNDLDPSAKDERISVLLGVLRAVQAVLTQPSHYQAITQDVDKMKRHVEEMRSNTIVCLMLISQVVGSA